MSIKNHIKEILNIIHDLQFNKNDDSQKNKKNCCCNNQDCKCTDHNNRNHEQKRDCEKNDNKKNNDEKKNEQNDKCDCRLNDGHDNEKNQHNNNNDKFNGKFDNPPQNPGNIEEFDEIIKNTPRRVSKALNELLDGYNTDFDNLNFTSFNSPMNDMVIVQNIPFESMCVHHLLPINGVVSIAYIPQNRVLGISKFSRIVDIFAHRLQLQERMTFQIAQYVMEIIKASGVAVYVSAEHMCIANRGVKKKGTRIISNVFLGEFKTSSSLRMEFLRMCCG